MCASSKLVQITKQNFFCNKQFNFFSETSSDHFGKLITILGNIKLRVINKVDGQNEPH